MEEKNAKRKATHNICTQLETVFAGHPEQPKMLNCLFNHEYDLFFHLLQQVEEIHDVLVTHHTSELKLLYENRKFKATRVVRRDRSPKRTPGIVVDVVQTTHAHETPEHNPPGSPPNLPTAIIPTPNPSPIPSPYPTVEIHQSFEPPSSSVLDIPEEPVGPVVPTSPLGPRHEDDDNASESQKEEKPRRCKLCPAQFDYLYELKEHDKTHWKYVCDHCKEKGMEYRSQGENGLKEHILLKHEIGAFNQCPHCPKKFARHANLTIHVNTEHADNPFKCKYPGCTKKFRSASARDKHKLLKHNKKPPLICAKCGKVFKHSKSYNKHMLLHHEMDTFKCSYAGCKASFPSQHRLTRHEKEHEQNVDILDLVPAPSPPANSSQHSPSASSSSAPPDLLN